MLHSLVLLCAFVSVVLGALCTGKSGPCFCASTNQCLDVIQQDIATEYVPRKRSLVGQQTPPVCVHVGAKRDIFYTPVCESTDGSSSFLCDASGETTIDNGDTGAPMASSGFCCEGTPPTLCDGALGAQESDSCVDVTDGVDGGKCHFGICVGCIASPTTTSSLCSCEDSSATLGFQIASNIKRGAGSGNTGLCATVEPFPVQTAQGSLAVRISNWTIVGTLPLSVDLDTTFLKQFEGVFSYHVTNGRVELSCLPVGGFACSVSTIVFNVGGDFCYAEFNVGDRKRDDEDDRIIGGSLLAGDPFGVQSAPLVAALARVGGHHHQQ